jgi:hypothetical protein
MLKARGGEKNFQLSTFNALKATEGKGLGRVRKSDEMLKAKVRDPPSGGQTTAHWIQTFETA